METRLVAARLLALRRFEAADTILETALLRAPNHPALLEKYAASAHNDGRNLEAIERWSRLREVRPNLPLPWHAIAEKQREMQELANAAQAIRQALDRFPESFGVLREAARIADAQYDYRDAETLWCRTLRHPNAGADCWYGYTYNLIMLGRLDDAEAALSKASRLYPGGIVLRLNEARLSMAREDWDQAIQVLDAYRARDPDDAGSRNLHGIATMLRAFERSEPSLGRPVTRASVTVDRTDDDAPPVGAEVREHRL